MNTLTLLRTTFAKSLGWARIHHLEPPKLSGACFSLAGIPPYYPKTCSWVLLRTRQAQAQGRYGHILFSRGLCASAGREVGIHMHPTGVLGEVGTDKFRYLSILPTLLKDNMYYSPPNHLGPRFVSCHISRHDPKSAQHQKLIAHPRWPPSAMYPSRIPSLSHSF